MGKSDCPTEQELAAFNLGNMPEASLEAITGHLESCPRCEAFLDSLDDRTDSAIAALRHQGPAKGLRRIGALTGRRAAAELPAVPGYEVLGFLGEGGMGVVYRARQVALDRLVALKLLRGGCRKRLARFRAEALADARLQHPHVVQIFEIGEHQGQPYLALELLEGGSLEAKLAGKPQTPHAAATLVCVLARAMQYAHSRGIVHRDLKPSNVLLTAEGTAKIADFGLAKFLQATEGQTQEGDLVGTPRYMAPEQTSGAPEAVGPAADIYSLGVILYELLTGRAPLEAPTPVETLLLIRNQEPLPPSRLLPRLPRDVETICLKCLQKDPRRRYASAQELADDLERFLGGRPVVARPITMPQKALKWVRRNPVPALLLALLATSLLGGLAGVTWKWREADEQHQSAERKADAELQARKSADQLRRELAHESSLAMLRLGMSQAQEGFVTQGMHWMARALVIADDEEMTDLDRAIRLNLAHWQRRLILPRTHPLQQASILQATASPDGRWLASVERSNRAGMLWDLTREDAPPLPLGKGVKYTNFSDDSHVLMLAADAGVNRSEVRLWRRRATAAGEPAFEPWGDPLPIDGFIEQLRLSRDRETLVVVLSSEVQLWDPTGRSLRRPPLRDSAVGRSEGRIGLDGKSLLTLGPNNTVSRWDLRTGDAVGPPQQCLPPRPKQAGTTQQIGLRALSPDGRTLAVTFFEPDQKSGVPSDIRIQLWDLATGRDAELLPPSRLMPRALNFSLDGRVLAVRRKTRGEQGEEIQLYDVGGRQMLGVPLPHLKEVSSLAFFPDNRVLVTGGSDGNVRFWETATGQAIGVMPTDERSLSISIGAGQRVIAVANHGAKIWEAQLSGVTWASLPSPRDWGLRIQASTLSPDGRTIAVNSFQRTVQAWDMATGRAVMPPLPHGERVTSVTFEPAGSHLLTGCADGSVWRWEVPSGHSLGLQVRHPGKFSASLKFRSNLSPDGQTILTAGANEVACLWDAHTGKPRGDELHHASRVQGGGFSRDSRKVVTLTAEGFAQLWEANTGRPLGNLHHPAGLLAAAFSPDGAQLLTGCEDGVARLWAWETGTLRQSWTHRAPVLCVGFGPDGRTLFTGTGLPEGELRLWDRATGLPLGPALGPLGPPESVLWVEFSPDGRRLVMGGPGSTLPRLWELPEPVFGSARQVQSWVRSLTGTEMDQSGVLLPLNKTKEITP